MTRASPLGLGGGGERAAPIPASRPRQRQPEVQQVRFGRVPRLAVERGNRQPERLVSVAEVLRLRAHGAQRDRVAMRVTDGGGERGRGAEVRKGCAVRQLVDAHPAREPREIRGDRQQSMAHRGGGRRAQARSQVAGEQRGERVPREAAAEHPVAVDEYGQQPLGRSYLRGADALTARIEGRGNHAGQGTERRKLRRVEAVRGSARALVPSATAGREAQQQADRLLGGGERITGRRRHGGVRRHAQIRRRHLPAEPAGEDLGGERHDVRRGAAAPQPVRHRRTVVADDAARLARGRVDGVRQRLSRHHGLAHQRSQPGIGRKGITHRSVSERAKWGSTA
ncbi:hypothetical protein AB0I22_14015 [Streptomyces sp. NPDC050610]|uniref:hypothetical protein n=1 Tax=Streptomyces sp. NPDC050610 TaxID=3157097 RepID=UPI0034433236